MEFWVYLFLVIVLAVTLGALTRNLWGTIIGVVLGFLVGWYFVIPFLFGHVGTPCNPGQVLNAQGVCVLPAVASPQTTGGQGQGGQPPAASGQQSSGIINTGLVQIDASCYTHMPGGNPKQPYDETFTIPNGCPTLTCFNGVSAAVFEGDKRLGGGNNQIAIRGEPGHTYRVHGNPPNGAFDWKETCN